ncbi:MAG: class I SAM-dependent methyltransferase [Methanocellales archaeon]|nr:class I SAM-dependent methyltransferase [Methanocellales archaeon]
MKIFESMIGAPLIARTYAKHSEFFRDFYAEAATEIVSRLEKGTVLDIGTGPAYLPIEITKRSKLSVIGIDVSKRMVLMAMQNVKREHLEDKIRIEEGDAHRLEFPDDHFDLVVSTASLHHWHDPTGVFDEIYRVLKPCGIALIADLRRDAPMEKVKELTKQMPFFCRFGNAS